LFMQLTEEAIIHPYFNPNHFNGLLLSLCLAGILAYQAIATFIFNRALRFGGNLAPLKAIE
jgi:hypothetical protein